MAYGDINNDPMNNVGVVIGRFKGPDCHSGPVASLQPGLVFKDAVHPYTKAQLGMGEIGKPITANPWVTRRPNGKV